jgi:Zn-dependent M28 family amino/carboxypeptidase
MELKERLQRHLTELVRERDPYLASAGHFYVQQYIRQQLERWGKVETHEFEIRGKTHQNLILNLPPHPPPNPPDQGGVLKAGRLSKGEFPPILIGAHYDAVPGTPGADDNGTGVAALLELAKAFATEPTKHPIQLVAFDMEEYGLLGSAQYAADLKKKQQPLRLMMSLEMLGYCTSVPNSQRYPTGLKYFYPNQGNFIALIGNLSTIPDLIRLSGKIRQVGVLSEWLPVPNRGVIVPQTRLSDHASFWDKGYPAMMVTDTAFMRNPHYHKASDTIATVNLDFLAGVTQGLEIGIRTL